MNEPEKYINEIGKEVYKNVSPSTPFNELDFHPVGDQCGSDIQYALHTNLGSLTVLDRLTGFGYRDIETGYRDIEGKFWLASGGQDVRDISAVTIQDAINWVKNNANTCNPDYKVMNELTVKFDNDGDVQTISLNDEDLIDRLQPSAFLPLHTFIESLRVDEKEYTE